MILEIAVMLNNARAKLMNRSQIRQVFMNGSSMPRSTSPHLAQYFNKLRNTRNDESASQLESKLKRRETALLKTKKALEKARQNDRSLD